MPMQGWPKKLQESIWCGVVRRGEAKSCEGAKFGSEGRMVSGYLRVISELLELIKTLSRLIIGRLLRRTRKT